MSVNVRRGAGSGFLKKGEKTEIDTASSDSKASRPRTTRAGERGVWGFRYFSNPYGTECFEREQALNTD